MVVVCYCLLCLLLVFISIMLYVHYYILFYITLKLVKTIVAGYIDIHCVLNAVCP